METRTIQLRARGTLTLPARVRERYALAEGDPVTLVDLDGVILLAPRLGVVPKLAAEIERLRIAASMSEEELIAGVREERETYRSTPTDAEA
ncbi:MAG: hypothetical protein C0498_00255 [Anaerolinea sp.]|nr:hypothetical protein [Anaerolinea sp.]